MHKPNNETRGNTYKIDILFNAIFWFLFFNSRSYSLLDIYKLGIIMIEWSSYMYENEKLTCYSTPTTTIKWYHITVWHQNTNVIKCVCVRLEKGRNFHILDIITLFVYGLKPGAQWARMIFSPKKEEERIKYFFMTTYLQQDMKWVVSASKIIWYVKHYYSWDIMGIEINR